MNTTLPRLGRAWCVETDQPRGSMPVIVPTAEQLALPEKAVQFGTGAFLRGFVDYFLDVANAQGAFNGRTVAIGSTGSGRDRALAEQDGLYTLVTRGLERGQHVESARVVASVSRALSATTEWDAVLACARNPHLELIFSNTTEVGLALDATDAPELSPPRSFPGKLTRFLYERARTFAFASTKGVIVLPCELLEQNGQLLKSLVLSLADAWGYEPGFRRWVESSVTFCDTLVDRIVPGAPSGADAHQLREQLGYDDAMLTTAETFRLFVIQGDDTLRDRLGFATSDPGVLVTPDIEAYRQRKVGLLNGAHTVSVTAALLAGCTTVAEAMEHEQIGPFVQRVLLEEIAPILEVPDASAFAHAVLERFRNPYVQHALLGITLHGTTKLRVRVVPTLVRAVERLGTVPHGIALGFAAHLAWLVRTVDEAAADPRTVPADAPGDRIRARWDTQTGASYATLRTFVQDILADQELWGVDLTMLPRFTDIVTQLLFDLRTHGVSHTMGHLYTTSSLRTI